MGRLKRIFLTGILALLPLIVTVLVVGWVVSMLNDYIGPASWLGRRIALLGADTFAPYVIGLVVLLAAVFVLGLVVDSRFGNWPMGLVEAILRRIPLVSNVYDLSKRFTSFVDVEGGNDIKTMKPVWCFFGGEPGAAVLALQPSSAAVRLGSELYVGILVPSAPVPVGGALIYVPQSWVRPADGGVDHLMSVYVSMGVTAPKAV